jgi:ubiquinone biosynthesis protein UbiJ
VVKLALGSIERLLNALLEESTPARERAAGLDGKSLGLRLAGPDIEILIRADRGRLSLQRGPARSADVSVSGTPIALLDAWRQGKSGLLAGGGVSVSGDAQTLEDFVRLFELATPDIEEELSRATGDVIAHDAFRLLGSMRAWAAHALDAIAMNTGEYLQEESRDLPARHELEGFFRDVEILRDDIERAVVRGERLLARRRRNTGEDSGQTAAFGSREL